MRWRENSTNRMTGVIKIVLTVLEIELFILLGYVNGQSECMIQDGKCTYNINLSPAERCQSLASEPISKIDIAPEAIKQQDDTEMYKMQHDLNVVKSDHENRIKELEQSIQKVLRNAIPTVPVDYSGKASPVLVDKRPSDLRKTSREEEGRFQGSEDTLLMQLQSQFNRLRSSLSKRTADLLETKNKLNETADLLKETQKQLFTSSNQLAVFESKSTILERETNILKNKLKHKTEKLDYTEERLNHSETKLLSLENQLYDLVRAEATLREEYETVKLKLNKTETELGELRRNHTTLTTKFHRTKKTLHFREEELMECYTAKTQTFCGFEDPDLCGYTQPNGTDIFDWERVRGKTPSQHTGPTEDHTCRDKNGHYMYIEASGKSKGDNALLYSPKYRGLQPQCIRFYYHMTGRHTGTLTVYTKLLTSDELQSVWRVFGNQGNVWIQARLLIAEEIAKAGYQIIFEAVTEGGYEGDIAIDDIRIQDGECVSDFNTVEVKPRITGMSQSLQEQIHRYRKLLRRRHRWRQNRNSKEKLNSTEKDRLNSASRETMNNNSTETV